MSTEDADTGDTDADGDSASLASQSKSKRTRRVLKEVSTVLSLATLVTLFATLLGIPNKVTAILNLVVAAIILLTFHGDSIKKVGSPLFLSLLLVLALGACGIIYATTSPCIPGLVGEYGKAGDIHGEMTRRINDTEKDLFLFGSSFHITLDERNSEVLNALRRGVTVRILVFDPDSPNIGLLSRVLNNPETQLYKECQSTVNYLRELRSAWSLERDKHTTPGSLEIKLHDTIPHARLYFFDHSSDGTALIIPYINQQRSVASPAWEFEAEAETAQLYWSGANAVWTSSKTVL